VSHLDGISVVQIDPKDSNTMIFLVRANFLTIFETLLTALRGYNSALSINLTEVYGTGYYHTPTLMVSQSVGSLGYVAASQYCNGLRSSLYFAYSDMNLTDMYSHFGLDSVWTSLYKSKQANQLLDDYGYPAALSTLDAFIDMSHLVLTELNETSAISLDKNGTNFVYNMALKTEAKGTLCLKSLPFPTKKADLDKLGAVIQTVQKVLKEKEAKIMFISKEARRKVKLLKVLAEDSVINPTKEKSLQTTLYTYLADAKLTVETVTRSLTSISSELDVDWFLVQNLALLEGLDNLLYELREPLDFPLGLVDFDTKRPLTPADTVSTYFLPPDSIVIQIGEASQATSTTKNSSNGTGTYLHVANTTYFSFLLDSYKAASFWRFTLPDIVASTISLLLAFLMLIQCCFMMKNRRKAVKLEKKYGQSVQARVKMIHENIRETKQPKICEPKTPEPPRVKKVASRKRKYTNVRYREVEAETIPSHSISQLPLYLANSDLSVDEIGTEMQEKNRSLFRR
jgi:hypothetical protein